MSGAHPDSTHGVAIIGMACRFAGIDGIDAFWQALLRGEDRVARAPAERWDAEAYPDRVSHGGFLEGIDGFDTGFFSVSDSEADYMCPQQRLLLELSWHTLEHASVVPSSLKGSDTGVFVGLCGHDFSILHWQRNDSLYLGTGTSNSVAANRISFQYGLHGPSFAIDAACSSSLVAVHLACRSILSGECSQALAGSSNILLVPDVTASLAQGGLISEDGRCKSFGSGADGYVRSEGAGMVMLKRLDLAERDGDRILGTILASGMNHNGRSNGLTAPNPVAQTALIRQCIAASGVDATQIDYLEAAATGTRLGDAIEAKAIRDSLVAARGDGAALTVGSVKSNLGHLEGTGGIAGLIKTLLCIEHGQIPASLHSNTLNPLCQIDARQLHVPQQTIDWPRVRQDRIAAVSSFGFGGSNAHLVLRGVAAPVHAAGSPALRVLPLSAHSPAALDATLAALLGMVQGDASIDLDALVATAALGREHQRHRTALVFDSRAALLTALADPPPATSLQASSQAIVLRGVLDSNAPHLAALAATHATFAAVVEAADIELGGQLSIRRWLRGGAVDDAQRPLLQLALDYCIGTWLGGLLAEPILHVGEGIGEIAAAMRVLGIPLRDADALLQGDVARAASRLTGKRLQLHVPASARLSGVAWPWRSSLLATLPDAQRCPVFDPAAIAVDAALYPADMLCVLYRNGARIDWSTIHARNGARHAAFPRYPFQRTRHWPQAALASATRATIDGGLVGESMALPLSDERRRRYRFDPAQSAVLADHVIDGSAILSAAAQIALCAQALFDEFGRSDAIALVDVDFVAPLHLEHGRTIDAQLLIQPATASSGRCVLVAADGSGTPRWEVLFTTDYTLDPVADADNVTPDIVSVPLPPGFYPALAARGHQYGPGYRWLCERGSGDERRFRLANDTATPAGVPWHPGLLDGCLHALWELTPDTGADTIALPRGIGRVALQRPRETSAFYILDGERVADHRTGPHHLRVRDARGATVIALHDLRLVIVTRAELAALRAASVGSDGGVETHDVHGTEALLKRAFDRVLGGAFAHDHADRPLPALGIDSLKAMELRGYLWRTFRADIGVAQLLGGISFNTLLQQLSADGAASPALNLQAAFAPAELDVVSFDAAPQDAQVEIEL